MMNNSTSKTIDLLCFGIKVNLTGDGGGSITSDLKEICPYCDHIDCSFSCDGSVSQFDDPEKNLQTEEEQQNRVNYNAAMDALESLIMAHAIAGIDIENPAYIEGIETAVNSIGNNL